MQEKVQKILKTFLELIKKCKKVAAMAFWL